MFRTLEKITSGDLVVRLESDAECAAGLDIEEKESGLYEVSCRLEKPSSDWKSLRILFDSPMIDIECSWSPGIYGNPASMRSRGINEWHYSYDSSLCSYFPITMLMNRQEQNRQSVSCSELVLPVKVSCGAYEEDCAARAAFAFHLSDQRKSVSFRVDLRHHRFDDAVREHVIWMNRQAGESLPVSEGADDPVYSTWYSFHQNIFAESIEEEADAFLPAGCRTIIVDDGWQTEDNRRGYAFCGDWNPSAVRFKDIGLHIRGLQQKGMRYLLWISVPFVGPESEAWAVMKNRLLYFDEVNGAGVVDIRDSRVQDYLIEKYCALVGGLGLDGLKLDFLDQFICKGDDFELQASVQLALEQFLLRLKERLLALNPSLLIEFRQRYIGPSMKQFGNLFRAHDCPHDAVMNRMHTLDLRLTSSPAVVHSDMVIWNPKERVEQAALNLINILFSVPQISIRAADYPADHLEMIRFWLGFWLEHRDLLLNAPVSLSRPDLGYSSASVADEELEIAVIFESLPYRIRNLQRRRLILINASAEERILIENERQIEVKMLQRDCCGKNKSRSEKTVVSGLSSLPLSRSAILDIEIS